MKFAIFALFATSCWLHTADSLIDFGSTRKTRSVGTREKLIDDLIAGRTKNQAHPEKYDKKIRPIPVDKRTDQHVDGPVKIKFKIAIDQLIEVNEVKQRIILKTWFIHEWKDCRLEWDPVQYANIEQVHINAEKLWLPDFMIYNNADGDFAIQDMVRARVDHGGTVFWKAPINVKTYCEINVKDFPFDEQVCKLKVGPWTHPTTKIKMIDFENKTSHLKEVITTPQRRAVPVIDPSTDLIRLSNNKNITRSEKSVLCEMPSFDKFDISGEWELTGMSCWNHNVYYACCKGTFYSDFSYFIRFKRRPLYLLVNIVFPTFLFSLLACAVFYLPADSGEKMTLCISILLSLAVFLMVIVDAIPSTAKAVPLLASYVLFTTILVAVSVALTVVVQNIHHRGPTTHEMPTWIRVVFIKYLPKIIPSRSIRKLDPVGPLPPSISAMDKRNLPNDKQVRQALEGLQFMAKTTQMNEYEDSLANEWKYVAMVLDHFLLYVFIFVVLFGTGIIFGPKMGDIWNARGRDLMYMRDSSG